MAEVINLRQARKRAAHAAARRHGAENAARSGRSAADKARHAAAVERARTILDAHRREDKDDGAG